MPLLLCLQELQGEVTEDGKTVSLHCFPADQKIVNAWKKCILEHPIAQATRSCLLPDTLTTDLQKYLKVGTVNFVNPLPPPSIVKKVCIGSEKTARGLK